MASTLKASLQRLVRSLGYEIRRYSPDSSERAQLMAALRYHSIDLIFDIGANTGQFGRYMRELGYKGTIVSFEPMKAAYERLLEETRHDERWTAAMRAAIGATNGDVCLHVAANSASSSILPMLEAHTKAAPQSSYVRTESVPLRTLDSLASEYISNTSKLFLKIDTQGYEAHVLEGSENTLARASMLQVELSLVDLYAGQKLMPEMIELLRRRGFSLWGLSPVFADPHTGRVLQIDGIFSRSS